MGKICKTSVSSVIRTAQGLCKGDGPDALRMWLLVGDLSVVQGTGLQYICVSDNASPESFLHDSYSAISRHVVNQIQTVGRFNDIRNFHGLCARVQQRDIPSSCKPNLHRLKSPSNVQVAQHYYQQLALDAPFGSTKAYYQKEVAFLNRLSDIGWKSISFATDIDGYPVERFYHRRDQLMSAHVCAMALIEAGKVDKLGHDMRVIHDKFPDLVSDLSYSIRQRGAKTGRSAYFRAAAAGMNNHAGNAVRASAAVCG